MLLGSSTTQMRLVSRLSSRQTAQTTSSVMLLQTEQYRLLFLRSRIAWAMPAASSFGIPRTAKASRSALFLPIPGSLMNASTVRPRALPEISASCFPAFSRFLGRPDDGPSCSGAAAALSCPPCSMLEPTAGHKGTKTRRNKAFLKHGLLRAFVANYLKQTRGEPHARGKPAHFVLHQLLGLPEGLVHRGGDQVLKHLDVAGVHHRLVDLDPPQWMNMPNFDSRHHFMRASRCSFVSEATPCASAGGPIESAPARAISI